MTPLKTLYQLAVARSQRKRPKRVSDSKLFERYVPKAVDDFLRKRKCQ